MILYLSGPISSDARYLEKFFNAECRLSRIYEGEHVVLNPATLPQGLKEYTDYMDISFAMLRAAEGIVMLPGWKRSGGARDELQFALMRGIKVFFGVESVPSGKNPQTRKEGGP